MPSVTRIDAKWITQRIDAVACCHSARFNELRVRKTLVAANPKHRNINIFVVTEQRRVVRDSIGYHDLDSTRAIDYVAIGQDQGGARCRIDFVDDAGPRAVVGNDLDHRWADPLHEICR